MSLKNQKIHLQYTLLLLIPSSPETFKSITSWFTIHFATINTLSKPTQGYFHIVFTIHFATINTLEGLKEDGTDENLQYTLLLLIHSILAIYIFQISHLQYTLLLLILTGLERYSIEQLNLQYTLLLLILLIKDCDNKIKINLQYTLLLLILQSR